MSARLPLAMVVAMARDRVIGRDGGIPWHFPEDMKHFRAVTRGHAIIAGRKTYQSIGKPLPDRRNIVITRDREFAAPGCEVVASLEDALALAREHDDEPRVIGGAEIYARALPLATKLYVTDIARVVDGDVFFPAWDDGSWREVERRESGELLFRTLIRD